MLLFVLPARAQVIINPAALDQLAGIHPPVITAPPAIRHLPRRISYRHALARRIAGGHRSTISRVIARPAPAVAPGVARPAAPPAPRLPPAATIDFAAGATDLPGGSAAVLQPFCHSRGLIVIDAYAAADPADPSSAPRLSMQRAFAIRDALTACGIPSGSIIPRANGAADATNPDAARISASP